MKLYEHSLNGKKVGYYSSTVFLVQIGKGKKGGYKTLSFKVNGSYLTDFVGDLVKAEFYYNLLHIPKGYKKRLYMPSAKKPVLLKHKA